MAKEAQKTLPAPATAAKGTPAIYSIPAHKEDKEYFLNESIRTGLSQKDLLKAAVEALKKGPKIPNALPIKLA